jgi:hypothetical protein
MAILMVFKSAQNATYGCVMTKRWKSMWPNGVAYVAFVKKSYAIPTNISTSLIITQIVAANGSRRRSSIRRVNALAVRWMLCCAASHGIPNTIGANRKSLTNLLRPRSPRSHVRQSKRKSWQHLVSLKNVPLINTIVYRMQ